jgi:hypothetical protein
MEQLNHSNRQVNVASPMNSYVRQYSTNCFINIFINSIFVYRLIGNVLMQLSLDYMSHLANP